MAIYKERNRNLEKNQNYKIDYFKKQLLNPYESTKKFFNFLDKKVEINKDKYFLDACGGSGANALYAAKKYSLNKIDVFDNQNTYLNIGKSFCKKNNFEKVNFLNENLYSLSKKICNNNYDGIFCLQTLSHLDNHELALSQLNKINSPWIALSSLFYEGLIDAFIEINEYKDSLEVKNKSQYNIFSIPKIEVFLKNLGFRAIFWEEFKINIPLSKGNINEMGSYTKELKNSEKLSISGPLMLNYWFMLAIK